MSATAARAVPHTPDIRTVPTMLGESTQVFFGTLDDADNLVAMFGRTVTEPLDALRQMLAAGADTRLEPLAAPLVGPSSATLYGGVIAHAPEGRVLLLRAFRATDVHASLAPEPVIEAFRATLEL